MKSSFKRSFIVCIVMLVTVGVTLGVAGTWAWYTLSSGKEINVDLDAKGFLVIAFDTSITVDPVDEALCPAVEAPNAIANNLPMDVLTLSDSITKVANKVSYETDVNVFVDKNELDEFVPQNIYFGLSAKINTLTGKKYSVKQENLTNIFGYTFELAAEDIYDEYSEEEEEPTPQSADQTIEYQAFNLGAPYLIEKSTKMHIKVTLWLSQPQGLLDPQLVDSSVKLLINVKVNPEEATA